MNEERLTNIEARANAATPGPWHTQADDLEGFIRSGSGDVIFGGELHEGYIDPDDPDAIFTAHAREDIPALVTEVRRLQKALEMLLVATGALESPH